MGNQSQVLYFVTLRCTGMDYHSERPETQLDANILTPSWNKSFGNTDQGEGMITSYLKHHHFCNKVCGAGGWSRDMGDAGQNLLQR
jgi:hypothetical protein